MSAIRNPAATHILSRGAASAVASAAAGGALSVSSTPRTIHTRRLRLGAPAKDHYSTMRSSKQLRIGHRHARQLATMSLGTVDQGLGHSGGSTAQAIIPRLAALDTLSTHVAGGDVLSAYQTVLRMKREGQLQTSSGQPTAHVIQDSKVTLALVEVIKRQHVWEECLDCLNLIVDLRPSLFGKYTDKRFTQVGMAANKSIDPAVLSAVLDAILSPRFASLPERHLAGLTALQLISDYQVEASNEAARAIRIRIAGFTSNRHALNQVVRRLSMDAMSQQERYELALAHARCMDPESALEILATLADLSKEHRIEAQVAISMSLAECTRFDEANTRVNELYNDEAVWTEDQTGFDREVTRHQTQLHILLACMRAVIPRLPLTQNFHTIASRQRSVKYTPGYTDKIVAQFVGVQSSMRKVLSRETWRQSGLDKLLFSCECVLYSMAQTIGKHQDAVSLGQLAKRLHSLERSYRRKVVQTDADSNEQLLLRGVGAGTGPLRDFLWAVVLSPRMHQKKKMDIIQSEVEHAQEYIPGLTLSVADVEPALLAALPSALWHMSRRGNFKDDSSFVPADEFLRSIGQTSMHPYTEKLLDLARIAEGDECADHRLYPIRMWVAVLQGNHQQAMAVLGDSLDVSQVRIVPSSLALANTRNHAFYEQMLCALSTFRRGADAATTQVRSLMRTQEKPMPLTPRIATALLYCCATSRNIAVARDTVDSLEALNNYVVAPKIHELYMRVCFACGEVEKALAIFNQLNYSSKHTQIGEPSFVHIVSYMGNNRSSVAGVEHAFATWLAIMNYQGRVSAALLKQWQVAGLSRDSRGKRNMFLPESGLTAEQALETMGIERKQPGSLSNKQFVRDWEYAMVMSLVGAYISAGFTERALVWERWVLQAIELKQIRLTPELISRMADVQLKHLSRGTQEGMEMCLEYLVAVDKSLGIGLFRKNTYYMNQAPVLKSIALALRKDAASGELASQIKSYLSERDAAYIFDKIRKLV
ncbi:hypothetical protein GQ54DRAFT_287500 [Martensiomyces pterosporus]|nr:hypothetical protein GQ54DRAFT_287500 [Martensiomyces pterosporus]